MIINEFREWVIALNYSKLLWKISHNDAPKSNRFEETQMRTTLFSPEQSLWHNKSHWKWLGQQGPAL